ncbi:hypothetical protein AVEN_12250-1 [Araneus ventricosus]|uniref:THAP-type domain-containing protein n=1 Tax=Araneus ventricosus TaxID=182803 RepID=A0A4Y2U9X5_ARAVE|nr:hypothetical protein AVEN_12250-1 [Araneus ventricosus]
MVVSCCAFGCTEREVKGGPVTFHCFPKDEERRKIWEIKIRRENFKATKSSRLCSKHFSPDSFDREKLGGTWLKKTAVPTVFNFDKHVVERKITRKPLVRKRKHYLGDFDDDDMNSPTKARKLLSIAQSQQKKWKMKIKNAERKTKRLEKKLFTLTEMLSDLKKKRLATEPAANVLKV